MPSILAVWRFYLRLLVRQPALGLALVLALSVGIVPNLAAFLFLSEAVLKPLPVEREEELCKIGISFPAAGVVGGLVAYRTFLEWHQEDTLFQGVGAEIPVGLDLQLEGGTERLAGRFVTDDYFGVLGVKPALGSLLGKETFNGPNCVISWPLWKRHFGGDFQVIGRSLRLNNTPVTIVGVAPKDFSEWQEGVSFWVPVSILPQFAPREMIERPGYYVAQVVARLRPRVTIDQVRHRLSGDDSAAVGWRESGTTLAVDTIRAATTDPGMVRTLALLQIAAVLTLLVACGNASSLMLASGISRRSETAVRAATGATPAQRMVEAALEALLLAGLSCLLGAAVVWAVVRAFRAYLLPGLAVSPDWRLGVFSLVLCLGLAVLLCVSTLLAGWHRNALGSLRTGVIEGDRTPFRMRRGLVAMQVAFATGLLFLCLQLRVSAARLERMPVGFEPDRLYVVGLRLPEQRYPQHAWASAHAALLDAIRAVPGVRSAALVNRIGFPSKPLPGSLHLEDGRRYLNSQGGLAPTVYRVTPGYFRTLGVSLVAGQGFEADSFRGANNVAVVSETAARAFWPNGSAIGRRVKVYGEDPKWTEVVGVVKDVRYGGARSALGPAVYLPLTTPASNAVEVLIRADAPVAVPMVREALRRWDPTVPLIREGSLRDWVRLSTRDTRASAGAVTLLAALGAVLAATGMHGMASLSLRQRQRDLALRLALGATPVELARRVLVEVGMPATVGVVAGLMVSASLLRTVRHLLFGPALPWSLALGGTGLAIALVILLASVSVIVRTVRLNPAELLRTN